MSKKVQENKKSMNRGIAIFTAIVSVIPVVIISFTGFSSFKTPYGIYSLAVFGICIYFSCIFAMFAWRNKVLYIFMDIINVVASLGLVIYAYINSSYQGGLLLHIAAALLFTLGVYQSGDADQEDSFYSRYVVPMAIDIAGLLFVLWFINVKMNVIAHIVIVSIINFFTLSIFLIPSLVKLFSKGKQAFIDIANDDLEYEDKTEEEKVARDAKKAARNAKKVEKRELKKKQISTSSSKSKSSSLSSTRCWRINSREVYWISEELTKKFNEIVSEINSQIGNNNSTIRSTYDDGLANRAMASNKDMRRAVKYLRHSLKVMQKNLEKLSKIVFTEEDAYKTFTYDILKGKLKKGKNETDVINPEIIILRSYASKGYQYLGKIWRVELTSKRRETYASEIK